MDISQHTDTLDPLNQPKTVQEKIAYLHQTLKQRHEQIDRMAIALHDHQTDMLSTYVYSADVATPLANYQARLSDCPSLKDMLDTQQSRVVNDLQALSGGVSEHTKVVQEAGYQSSYTMALYAEGVLLGFLFYNSRQRDAFPASLLPELDMSGHLIAFMLFSERSKVKTLVATIRSASEMSRHRDPETGGHLERMAHYARIIAKELADRFGFSDAFIEHLYLFAPLHDIGKITIPDRILLKPDKLTDQEFSEMQLHAQNGRVIIDKLLQNYGLDGVEYIDMLRNIALYHHEAIDGSGYPERLLHEAIPIEARIVAVADVFDALTSERPYKTAWDNARAFAHMETLAGVKLDADCVHALLSQSAAIEQIQRTFFENRFG